MADEHDTAPSSDIATTNAPEKRPRGRPKGSKNGPNAGAVGRPRKLDGKAPKKRKLDNGHALPATSLPPEDREQDSTREGSELSTQSTPLPQNNQAGSGSLQPLCTCGGNTATANHSDSHTKTAMKRKAHEDTDGISNSLSPATTTIEETSMGERRDVEDVTATAATDARKVQNLWAPLPGVGLRDEYEEIDEGEEEDAIFDDEDTNLTNEFVPLEDDDESEMSTDTSGNTPLPRQVPRASGQDKTTIPVWLLKDYADTRERLSTEMKSHGSQPACYVRQSFWDGSNNTFFATRYKFAVEPELFYKPSYFVWIPHLLAGRIPCPDCVSKSRKGRDGKPVYLSAKGWPKMPRRVVDLDRCIYIIGYRYICGNEDCKKTFQSWSPRLLAALPRPLAMQFPFHLTYRSGLTDQVISFMRLSFLQGVGPNPFSKIILANHLRHYEHLHLQYLESLYMRVNSPFQTSKKPFSAFSDRAGYGGFSPSGRYFRDLYVSFMSSHATTMDQYTSMLSARILQIDHSFKIPKHLGKLNGVPVFTALHTGINEYNEIRSLVMTPTKAHNQFIPAIKGVDISLKTYGHDPIEAIFTDNPRADRAELERAIPSLSLDVTPVPSPTTLEHLVLPAKTSIIKLSSEYQVRTRFDTILANLRQNEEAYAAVDMEWSVDITSGIQSKVALISVTFGEEIFLVPIHQYLSTDGTCLKLPHSLLSFLYASHIHKIGVHVSGDLTRLFKDCGFVEGKDRPFVGALNLGKLAKETGASLKATVGLADLCATVLRRFLPKDPEIRVSSSWTDNPLPSSHENYAALDVYASWAIFKALSTVPIGGSVGLLTPGGTPVELLSADRSRIVAYGQIHPDRPTHYQGVALTKTRALVSITKILVPGHLVTKDLLPGDENLPLSTFFPVPFYMVCKLKHLRIHVNTPFSYPPPSEAMITTTASPGTSATHVEPSVTELAHVEDLTEDRTAEDSPWYTGMDDKLTAVEDAAVRNAQSNPVSLQQASVLKNKYVMPTATTHNNVLRTRVSGDIFHGMKQFPIVQAHGLRRPFARALRDAIFQYDGEDLMNVKTFLSSKGVTWEYMLRTHTSWALRRVRRFVPPPEELLPRVRDVLHRFGPLVDATTHKPLFVDKTWNIADNFLENIRSGLYSDPIGVKLYYPTGTDKYGLLTYRCIRGTNGVEGGVHQNIIRWFGAFNASPDFAVQLLHDYTLYHNLKVGYYNRTGRPYAGSYDIWTRNQIAHLVDILSPRLTGFPTDFGPHGGWVNGDNYVRSHEVFGILPVPPSIRERHNMHDFDLKFAKETKIKHIYLAQQQNTFIPVLPVHTKAERALFKAIASDPKGILSGKEPDWNAFALRWASHGDGQTIFYKLPEHLKSYWKTFQENNNEKISIKINLDTYNEIAALLRVNPTVRPGTVALARPEQLRQQLTRGEHKADEETVDRWHVSILLDSHSARQSAVKFSYGAERSMNSNPILQVLPLGENEVLPDNIDQRRPQVHHRKPRTCPRCGRADCEGRFNSRPCKV